MNNLFILFSSYAIVGYKLIPSMQNIYANFARMQTHSNIIDSYKSILENNTSSYKLNSNSLITQKFLNIEISNLQFSYENRKIFNNLDFSINRREIFCIAGNSGIGKSTLLKILLGSETPNNMRFKNK